MAKFNIIEKIWNAQTTPVLSKTEAGLVYWREKILLSLLFIITVFAGIAYIPSLILAIKADLFLIAAVDTICYLLIIIIFIFKKLSIFFRSFVVLSVNFVLAVFLFIQVGPAGAAYVWLFSIPILAALLLEAKYVVLSNITVIITLALFGYLQENDLVFYMIEASSNFTSWIIISVNFIFLEIVLSFCIVLLIRGLQKSLIIQRDISNDLSSQKQELENAKLTAENALEMKSEFLAQMSHEIRTPINTILSFISLIKEELKGRSSGLIKESFAMIENGSKRLIRTIDLILNMSEIKTNSTKVNKESFKIFEKVLIPLHHEFNQIAKTNGIVFEITTLPGCDPIVCADIYTVTQLFANLIDNSIKYTIKGRVDLLAEKCHGGKLVVKLKDTGIGMSKDFMEKLFQPFTQEETGYTRKFDGTGLGLSIVKSYCEINNFSISVKSKKDEGTVFSIEMTTEPD